MEITEVKIDRGGRLPVRVDLAGMEGVTFRQYDHAKFDLQPFAVEVEWALPYRLDAEPASVTAVGSRILKSGALGDTSRASFYTAYRGDPYQGWPVWVQSAVQAARPITWDIRVAGADDE